MPKLELQLNKLAGKKLSDFEMKEAVHNLTEFFDCLMIMKKGIEGEGGNLSESFDEGTGGRALIGCPSPTPYRILE